MAKIFSEVFTKPQFGMEDFLDHGYGTVRISFDVVEIADVSKLFDTEAERKIRKDPALASVDDAGVLFPSTDVEPERRAAGDIVGQLWAF
jgi:U3 small nucleolar RNA-associated protein 19